MTEHNETPPQTDVQEANDAPGKDEGKVKTIEIETADDKPEIDTEEHEEKDHDKKKKSSSSKKSRKKIEELEETIEKLTKERDEYKDNYLRNLAEIDNFRKRIKKEKEEFQRYVLGDFLLELLTVVDNLERALNSKNCNEETTASEGSIISGVEMIYKQILDLLKKNNVSEIDSLNKPFDPNLHQALSKDEQEDITEPTVIEVYQKGFLYNGKLLRPALVRVGVPVEIEEEPEIDDETGSEDEDEE